MSTPLENYRLSYFLNSVILEEDGHTLIIDQHQQHSLDLDQPIYLVDLDHTLLNTNALKELTRTSLQQFDISPAQFDQTYQQAKTAENFYDFHKHLEILSALIAPVQPVSMIPQKIQEFLFKTIDQQASSLIYANFKTWLSQAKPRNIMIDTSGTGEWQRQKVVACLTALNWEPQAVVLIENARKGWVISKLYQLLQSSQNQHPHLIVIDDNEDELEDIAKVNPDHHLGLYRIKQVNAQYNDKVTNAALGIIELDALTQPNLNLAKELTQSKPAV